MKEASGELNMTLVTIVAIAVVGAIFAAFWPTIKKTIDEKWNQGVTNTEKDSSTLNSGSGTIE